ncbi:Penicillin-binding protein, transpeptidase [Legionella beliardensis]|uniref:Penicillin-binding protein, transpeptidase n=1 Tax=Legionella beliardensis TaxID=91822 RepID=A0A378HZZ7_9GAMM|nr:M56 family metallopeptidase [Legionella beliardensis]STX28302.1 Penicillin-binding protein, transpeptidase [Legionella beliardensis]
MLFLEILLSIHCLLLVSSWIIGGRWLANQPSFKLKLTRLLLISCVISPLIVHWIDTTQKPKWLHYASIDTLQDYVHSPLKVEPSQKNFKLATAFSIGHMNFIQLFCVVFCLIILFRSYKVILSLWHLRALLAEAVSYRTCGKLIIKVSHRCNIPFSVALLNKAYIVLPVSLFSSTKNVKIALAHEGQHHRNGDCLWAYFIEILRVIFWGNPGVTRWRRILSELQEFSCDEVLVGQPKISAHDYGRCLFDVVQTVSQCSMSSNREIACTVGMALGKDNKDSTFIIRRISMLSTYPLNASKSFVLGLAFVGFSILAPICVAYSAVGVLTGSKTKEIDISQIDPKLQLIVEKEIRQAVQQYHAKSGVVAIVNVKTGNLIAFAEVSHDKNQISWKSRIFSPGSTIKPFIAAAAIDSGHSSETQSYTCHSPYSIEGEVFKDYKASNAPISLMQAMANSSNVCLIKISQETGAPVIRKKLAEFGFDMNTWWQANQSDELQLARVAVGENIPVTVDSLTKSYAMLANQGRPFKGSATPIISATTMSSINHILVNAVINGTGKLAAIPGVSVAGKTGTVVENSNLTKGKHLALFAGYVPINTPQYAMVVVIEDGHASKKDTILNSGGELAAPVFRSVAINSMKAANR